MNSGTNRVEKQTGLDLNGDGFVGGEGIESKLEKVTHIDFNGDGRIGRAPDTIPGGGGYPPTYYSNNYGGQGPY